MRGSSMFPRFRALSPHDEIDLLMRLAMEGLPPEAPSHPVNRLLWSLMTDAEHAMACIEAARMGGGEGVQ